MRIKTFSQAEEFLYHHLPKGIKQRFPGELALERTKYLLQLLGSPQNKIKIIHIAGTSGKGSTAYLTSLLLKTAGAKTGLILSPHLIDIRERFQINNSLLSKKMFVKYLNQLLPSIEKVKKTRLGSPTYFEILTALAFLIFYQEKVEYGVIETGLGGTYDATNSVKRKDKIVVITKIGLDHKHILGKTIKGIALNKAGIISNRNTVFSTHQLKPAEKILKIKTKEKKALFFYLGYDFNFKNLELKKQKTTFIFQFQKEKPIKITLGLIGQHQAENASLSLAVFKYICQREGIKPNWKKIKKELRKAFLIGRFQTIKINRKKIIVDGAHNPQKMAALAKTLKALYPNKKLNFLLAFKKKKDYKKMVKIILPLAENIFLTKFKTKKQDHLPTSIEPKIIRSYLIKQGFSNCQILKSQQTVVKWLKKTTSPLVVTGSLYFIGEVLAQNCLNPST